MTRQQPHILILLRLVTSSPFFQDEDYEQMKLLLEVMSGQTKEVTPKKVAFY